VNEPLKKRIADTISKGRVMLFMKGNPSMPQCGFSAAVVGVLKEIGVPFESTNILADNELREGLKEYSSWPTFPQLYIDGKLVGGADIVREMHAKGELAKLINQPDVA
jgi:monothiol glutaredoxin